MSSSENAISQSVPSSSQEKAVKPHSSSRLNAMWPIFGREELELELEDAGSFWEKDIAAFLSQKLNSYQYYGILSRVGKKNKVVKKYFYYLYNNYLCYCKNSMNRQIKGYIKLSLKVKLDQRYCKGHK